MGYPVCFIFGRPESGNKVDRWRSTRLRRRRVRSLAGCVGTSARMVLVGGASLVMLLAIAWLYLLIRPTSLRLTRGELILTGWWAQVTVTPAFLSTIGGLTLLTSPLLVSSSDWVRRLPPTAIATTVIVLAAVLIHELAHLSLARLAALAPPRLATINGPGQAEGAALSQRDGLGDNAMLPEPIRSELNFRLTGGSCRVAAVPIGWDLVIALAGPAANLALSGVAGIVRHLSVSGPGDLPVSDLGQLTLYLSIFNLTLGLSALLPVPGSDGWRAGHAAWWLWRRRSGPTYDALGNQP